MLLSCTEKDLHTYCSSQHHIPEPHPLCSPQGWLAAICIFTGYRAWGERATRHNHPACFQILIPLDQEVTFWSKGCSWKQPIQPTLAMKTHLEGAQENRIHNLELYLLTQVFASFPHTSTDDIRRCHDIQSIHNTYILFTLQTWYRFVIVA